MCVIETTELLLDFREGCGLLAEGACFAYHEDVVELVHIVDAFCEQLALHLVGDLVHSVSPVGHACCPSLYALCVSVCLKTVFFDFDFR